MGFLQKLDYDYDGFSNGDLRSNVINGKPAVRDPIMLDPKYKKEYNDALMNPDLIPAKTLYNIDKKCNFNTMFKTNEYRD
jgi:hypothetical protein